MEPPVYPLPTVRLERDRTTEQLVDQIRDVVAAQSGSGRFRFYGRRKRGRAYEIRDRLADSHHVEVLIPDREGRLARSRDWLKREITELYVRDLDHPSLRLRRLGEDWPVLPFTGEAPAESEFDDSPPP